MDIQKGGPLANSGHDYVSDYLRRSAAALDAAVKDPGFRRIIEDIANAIGGALKKGGKLMIAGNGGSAADAQHLAGEFLSRFSIDRRPLPAVALTTDTSVLTAIGNDYGFEYVFERQVRGLGRPGDVFLALSTSGRSRNILAALRAAREAGITTIGFTGSAASEMPGFCSYCLVAPSSETPVIQQIHMIAGHIICGLVERDVAGPDGSR